MHASHWKIYEECRRGRGPKVCESRNKRGAPVPYRPFDDREMYRAQTESSSEAVHSVFRLNRRNRWWIVAGNVFDLNGLYDLFVGNHGNFCGGLMAGSGNQRGMI